MLGLMRHLVVVVHVRPLHLGQTLQFHLQTLGHVMRDLQRDVRIKHDVDLDRQPGPAVPRAHGVDLLDQRVVVHGDVGQVLQGLGVCALADQHVELAGRGAQPEEGDEHAEDDGAHGVEPPAQLTAADGGEDTEAVDGEVVAVVLPEDLHLRVLVADAVAVEEKAELGGEGDADGDDGGEMEGGCVGGRGLREELRGEGDEDEGDGRHEEAEGDVSCGFDAGFAGGVFAAVDAGDGAVAEEQHDVGERVEDCVGHGGEEGEGARRDGGIHLQRGEHDVGGERAIDGDLVTQGVAFLGLAGVGDVGVDWLEEALDLVVLLCVKGCYFALLACVRPGQFLGVEDAVAQV